MPIPSLKLNLKPKVKLKRNQLIILLAIVVISAAFVVQAIVRNIFRNNSPQSSENIIINTSKKVDPGLPVLLKIPKIGVVAPIDEVGLTSEGDMDVPKLPANTAWYKPGVRPGEVGSAVIDGHFGWVGGVPAVFDNLHQLIAGDKIQVEDDKGMFITFIVKESRTYNPDEDATAVFHSSDGKAHLNLITCQGAWATGLQEYETRLVVFADKE